MAGSVRELSPQIAGDALGDLHTSGDFKQDQTLGVADENPVHWVDVHPDCAVCLQPCQQPVLLPCSHIFCFLCVKGFAYRSKKCALCRREVTLDYFKTPVVVKSKCSCKVEPKTQSVEHDVYKWYYEGRNGWWQYDERASCVLEDAFVSQKQECELVIAGFAYTVDFDSMVQYRKANPTRQRRIKRDKTSADRKGVAGLKTVSERSDCRAPNPLEAECRLEASEAISNGRENVPPDQERNFHDPVVVSAIFQERAQVCDDVSHSLNELVLDD